MAASTLEQRAQRRGTDLVLEGGGVRGIALAGAVVGLAEAGYTFPRVAGTSAGAIVGALTAAYQVAGIPLSRLHDEVDALDLAVLAAEGPLERLTGPIGEGVALLTHSGVYSTHKVAAWVRSRLEEAGVRTFADLKITSDEDTSLVPKQRYRFVSLVSDLTRRCLVRVPWDLPHYLLPEGTAASEAEQIAAIDAYPVVDAVLASASLPFVFRPFQQRTPHGTCTWVDGGLLAYFPVTVFDRTDGRPARWPTVGVRLSSRPSTTAPDRPIRTPFGEALELLRTAIGQWNRYALEDEGVDTRTVWVDATGVSPTDFSLDAATRDRLYADGRRAASEFLARQQPIPGS